MTAIADIRMTRSGWLGATAVGVLLLLGIGLSIDGGDPGRVGHGESILPAISASGPGGAAGDGSNADNGQFAVPPSPAPAVTLPIFSGPILTPSPHRLLPASRQFRANNASVAQHFDALADAQTRARIPNTAFFAPNRAAVPHLNGLTSQGNTIHGSSEDEARAQVRMENAARRALFAQVPAAVEGLKGAHNRIKPALAQFSRQHTAEAKPQETRPQEIKPQETRPQEIKQLLTDIHPLGEQRHAVRNDRPALSATPAVRPAVPAAASSPSSAAPSASPSRVFTASAMPPVPVKPDESRAAKSKAMEPSTPSFITWGK